MVNPCRTGVQCNSQPDISTNDDDANLRDKFAFIYE